MRLENTELEHRVCLCGSNRNERLIIKSMDKLSGLPGRFTVVKCGECGLLRTNPRPSRNSIGWYYPDSYTPYRASMIRNTRDLRFPRIRAVLRRLFETNNKRIPQLEPGSMLEIGCAAGAYMHEMVQKGWSVRGVEISEQAASMAVESGHDVFIGRIEDADYPSSAFDLVVGWMVLEHVHDPVGVLERIRAWLKLGGWLAISVPNAMSLERSFFGHNWFALQLPTHLYHFTPTAIRRLLEQTGYTSIRVLHQRNVSNIIASLAHVARRLGLPRWIPDRLLRITEKGRIINLILFPMAAALAIFGQTGRMTVWARKI